MAATGALTELIGNPVVADADCAACFGDGVSNTSVLGNFTLTTTGEINVIPVEAHGRWVRLLPTGSTMTYFFTFLSSASVPVATAATAAGARAATQGEGPFPAEQVVSVRVPHPPSGGRVYFARIGGTISQSVKMTLADGTVGLIGS
jgi:hypothetical protein